VTQILKDGGITSERFDFRLQNQYKPREYCVQYRETDLNYISRLLEEEGIFYFFEHSEEKHVLVFADSTVAYQQIQGEGEVTYNPSRGLVPEEEYVYGLAFSRRILSGKITRRDFNFEKPALDLTAQDEADSFKKLEIYDYPGNYLDQERGKKLAKIRLQEAITFKEMAEGSSVCSRFIPGFTFKLTDHEREEFNQEYLLVEVMTTGSQPQSLQEEVGAEAGATFSNEFLCIPSSVTLRPGRITPKPVVEGIQTAIVVGPKGEEIYTDEYGRVKVQFHWDREGKADEKSSCWIRVSQAWAGANWGAMFIPRIGHEVIVDFIEGDPDRPIITGSVYNGGLLPPYTLPDEKTKSTIKSRSSIGGKGSNEIRFEDKKGEEQFLFHAEKDMDIRVKNDRKEFIGNDRHLIVKRDKAQKVERDEHSLVDRDKITEVTRDLHLKVGGKQAIEITGSRSVTVKGDVIEGFRSNHSREVSGDLYLKAMGVVVEGMKELTVKVGGNFIKIDPSGVTIVGTMVKINSGGAPGIGTMPGLVSPVAPLEAVVADTIPLPKDPVLAKAQTAPAHKEPKEGEEEKSWIEIELVDEDDNPVSGEKYQIELPDGKIVTGTTNEKGVARVRGIDPGTCKICFPNLDKDAWEKM
jgi:type VI secretion system secreted protein VgrG